MTEQQFHRLADELTRRGLLGETAALTEITWSCPGGVTFVASPAAASADVDAASKLIEGWDERQKDSQ